MGGTGEPTSGEGLGIHLYVANTSMTDAAFTNAGASLCFFNDYFCLYHGIFIYMSSLHIIHLFTNTLSLLNSIDLQMAIF